MLFSCRFIWLLLLLPLDNTAPFYLSLRHSFLSVAVTMIANASWREGWSQRRRHNKNMDVLPIYFFSVTNFDLCSHPHSSIGLQYEIVKNEQRQQKILSFSWSNSSRDLCFYLDFGLAWARGTAHAVPHIQLLAAIFLQYSSRDLCFYLDFGRAWARGTAHADPHIQLLAAIFLNSGIWPFHLISTV